MGLNFFFDLQQTHRNVIQTPKAGISSGGMNFLAGTVHRLVKCEDTLTSCRSFIAPPTSGDQTCRNISQCASFDACPTGVVNAERHNEPSSPARVGDFWAASINRICVTSLLNKLSRRPAKSHNGTQRWAGKSTYTSATVTCPKFLASFCFKSKFKRLLMHYSQKKVSPVSSTYARPHPLMIQAKWRKVRQHRNGGVQRMDFLSGTQSSHPRGGIFPKTGWIFM